MRLCGRIEKHSHEYIISRPTVNILLLFKFRIKHFLFNKNEQIGIILYSRINILKAYR